MSLPSANDPSTAGAGDDDAPVTDLAQRRAEVTRDAIRHAVTALMAEEHPSVISVPAVAARAGVSVRTVYRYFPNKQALLDDVAHANLARVEKLSSEGDGLFADPATWLPFMWERFGEDVGAVRAQHQSPAGADLRDRRLARSREGVAAILGGLLPDIGEEQSEALTDVIVATTSSAMFLELHDRMGWAPSEAASMVLWMIDAVRQRIAAEGAAGVALLPE